MEVPSHFLKICYHRLIMREIVVVLDNIRSVHNVGSIFRTADGMGVRKLYLCGITPAPTDRFGRERQDLRKVALGAEKTVAWEKATATGRLLLELRHQGYELVALEQSPQAVPLRKFKTKARKLVLILGPEIAGLSVSILRRADRVVEIPMRGALVRQAHHPRRTGLGKESLNVAVAFGIAAYILRLS